MKATPISSVINSPAELLYNRQVRTNIPIKQQCGAEHVVEELHNRQLLQKQYYDRNSNDLSDLYPGQSVTMEDPKTLKWSTAQVLEKPMEPRSYKVIIPDGTVYRRNRKFLRDISPQLMQMTQPHISNDDISDYQHSSPESDEANNITKCVRSSLPDDQKTALAVSV